MNKKKQAVTLVELLVVISLLIILWSIWFFTLSSYLQTIRDSNRVVEFENIESSLGSYMVRKWLYPNPTDWVGIVYSGWLVWTQWTFSNDISNIIWYSEDVLDPLTKNFYTYSVKNNQKSFSIAWVLEDIPELAYNNNTITWNNSTGDKYNTALVWWNYNGEIISVQSGSINFILALPSIVSTDIISSIDLVDIVDNNKLVYNNFTNLPSSYLWSRYTLDNNIDFLLNNLLVKTWSISDLKQTSNQIDLLQDIYNAYSGSILWDNISVSKIDPNDLFYSGAPNKIKILACDMVKFKLKYFVDCE